MHPPPVPLEDVVDDGLMAIQRGMFLRKAGVDTSADEDFLSNLPSKAELLESGIKNIIRSCNPMCFDQRNPCIMKANPSNLHIYFSFCGNNKIYFLL